MLGWRFLLFYFFASKSSFHFFFSFGFAPFSFPWGLEIRVWKKTRKKKILRQRNGNLNDASLVKGQRNTFAKLILQHQWLTLTLFDLYLVFLLKIILVCLFYSASPPTPSKMIILQNNQISIWIYHIRKNNQISQYDFILWNLIIFSIMRNTY